jgi:hypothetical protein
MASQVNVRRRQRVDVDEKAVVHAVELDGLPAGVSMT